MTNHSPQRILVFQQNGSGEAKIAGIRRYGGPHIELACMAIDKPLPPVLDDTTTILPAQIEADLVLDFLQHPDLSEDLAVLCSRQSIPVVAAGRKIRYAVTPPT